MKKSTKLLTILVFIILLIFIGTRLFYYIQNKNQNVQFWIGNHSPLDSIQVVLYVDSIEFFNENISNQEFYKIYKHKLSFGNHHLMFRINSDTIFNSKIMVFPNKWIAIEYYGKDYDNEFSITIKSSPIRIE